MKKKNIIISTAALLILAGAGLWIFGGRKAEKNIDFATATVQKGNVSNSITATGTIEPVTEVQVGTQVSGIIDKIYVDYNTVVKAGQVIAEMDRVTLLNDLQSAQASYNGNEAEYHYQQKLFERYRTLHEKQLISDTEYEQYEYNYRRAKSAYEQSKALLDKAKQNLSYTRENVLTVPNKALRFHPDEKLAGNRPIHDCDAPKKLWRLDEKGWTAIPVKTGLSDGANTEIVSGIKEGDSIVTEAVIKSQAGPAAPQETEQEQSPFMPGPRGKKK